MSSFSTSHHTLKSNDGREVLISTRAIQQLTTLNNSTETYIHFPNINGATLQLIAEWFETQEDTQKFIDFSEKIKGLDVYDLLIAANSMGVKSLIDYLFNFMIKKAVVVSEVVSGKMKTDEDKDAIERAIHESINNDNQFSVDII
ncbi:hypothetical protein GCK72_011102 [Caenorhabditis remanei]|uniref:SKP1 component dimerisation domain-containing protein n=1 Tax=Caenorhabditis remanei TaxID=31234 RepID=A0A6A5H704_CAERE|nr:hypothetical protein GCK72_011102 [Caenorhabditis remanei]KAF1762839.1 hypothetical protein GCK72_011102 [Caenorhabditis remanei]